MYTDPQIHSLERKLFGGKSNLGQEGINKFLLGHNCNDICKLLHLPKINKQLQLEKHSDMSKFSVCFEEADMFELPPMSAEPARCLCNIM